VENKKEDRLFGFTSDQIYEAMKIFQKMDQKEARDFLMNNPLAKIFMKDLYTPKKNKQDG